VTRILDGNALAEHLRAEVAEQVSALVRSGMRPPSLRVVLVGDDPASRIYVKSKAGDSAEVGIDGQTVELPASIGQHELLALIDRLNQDDAIDGILVQLPLPAGLQVPAVQSRVSPAKDVDCLHPENVGRLWLDLDGFVPCTPAGILELLLRQGIELVGRHAVVVGRSAIVGKPMAALFLRQHCTVTICHSRTRDLAGLCRQADVLVAAVGRPGFITEQHVREGAVVVDVGINRLTDRAIVERLFPGDKKKLTAWERRGSVLAGDVDFVRVAPKASAITPVPGGVGPLTRALLLVNTLKAYRARAG
jgi:methylenetetrahydrofolate dehydrogenase (NADP+)/methenyltetrahydrofolate cyclohydrolase